MRRSFSRLAALCAVLILGCGALAWGIDPVELPNAQLQARYVALTHEMRCVQCLNSTLADSEVEIAGEVRREIRNMLLAGKTDDQIRDYMVSRYSEFILFKPRFSARNAWLWTAPGVLLAIGAIVAWRIVRQRARLLPDDEEALPEEPLVQSTAGSRGGGWIIAAAVVILLGAVAIIGARSRGYAWHPEAPPATADALLSRAEALLRDNEAALDGEAGELIERALALDPRSGKALFYGAAVAMRHNEPRLARDRYAALLALNPPANVKPILEGQIAALDKQLASASQGGVGGAN
jgi:cytochrome c-type biogenesis protein CcmH